MPSSNRSKSKRECTIQIDLPGQEVQCWDTKAKKLKVVLRKHRDVIFDVQQFHGMTYTIRSDKSDVYHAESKKLIRKNQAISFKDGEKAHLWISREFEGSLRLQAAGKTIGKYYPSELDPCRYTREPADKPAPFMVVLRNDDSSAKANEKKRIDKIFPAMDVNHDYVKFLDKSPVEFSVQSALIVEFLGDVEKLPREVAEFVKNGGEPLSIDPSKLITRNWIVSQVIGVSAFYSDNSEIVKEVSKSKALVMRLSREGRELYYLVLKAGPTIRRYAFNEEKVLAFTSSIASGKGLRHGAWQATKGAFSKAGLLAVAFNTTITIVEWLKDYADIDPITGKPKRDVADLLAKIGVDLLKVALSAAITSALIGMFALAGIACGGVVLVVGVIALSIVVGLAIDYLEGKVGLTKSLGEAIRSSTEDLKKKMPNDYDNFELYHEGTTKFEFGSS